MSPIANYSSYLVVTGETSSASKQDNLINAIQADMTAAEAAITALQAATPAGPPFLVPPAGVVGTTTLVANTAYFGRFFTAAAFTVVSVELNLSVSSGNIDVGIYSEVAGLPSARQWSRGSIASPGTGLQSILISAGTPTTLTLSPGTYWLGFSADNTGVAVSYAGSLPKGLGYTKAATFPLPATIVTPTASALAPYAVLL